jgi:hypothetical protein
MLSIILKASNFQAWVPDLLQISERSTDSREMDGASSTAIVPKIPISHYTTVELTITKLLTTIVNRDECTSLIACVPAFCNIHTTLPNIALSASSVEKSRPAQNSATSS